MGKVCSSERPALPDYFILILFFLLSTKDFSLIVLSSFATDATVTCNSCHVTLIEFVKVIKV